MTITLRLGYREHLLAAGKAHEQLLSLEAELLGQLARGEAADPEFTAAVLARLGGAKAKAQLREIHAARLTQHVQLLESRADPADVAAAMGWNDEAEAADAAAEVRPTRKGARQSIAGQLRQLPCVHNLHWPST